MLDPKSALPQRFWDKTRSEDTGYRTPCLTWTAFKQPNGYGKFGLNGKSQYAHRVAYEALIGPIAAGLMIDHLCRNRACVNVEHMEAVTNKVNILRGETIMAANAAKTHCPNGHEYTEENTYISPSSGGRTCRTCIREWRAKRSEREKAERRAKPKEEPTHCRNGHPINDANRYITPRGWRACRACTRDSKARYNERKKQR
ncbi:HNH endonuclease signature motif containing protein [Streptomyces viridochromogenes]|uniref:HNH endonuclease signature motif containing protein n=1 Tax=Streptomyces viridochromogenes TaxID=1938 RepID=UPI00069F0475|nr:HNH endonuclease signature motif containing protein [Streptomyces viridochromogenes]